MKKIRPQLLLFLIAFGVTGENVQAQGLKLNGVGGRIAYVDPEQLSGTVGLGGYLNFTAGKFALLPTVEYWTKSSTNLDFSQWLLAADARYYYSSTESLKPFIGLGLGVLSTDVGIGDASSDFGLDVLGGVDIPINEKLSFSGEIKFVVTDLHSIRLSGGLTYFWGNSK
jgi:opacity protein-like surface antigen